jgi:hypothetical protein
LDSPKIVERAYIKAGCNDGEKMDGYIEYWDGQNWKYLTSFSDVGCGDYVPFDQATTRKLRLTMTGGGGDDEHISWHCCGSDGWKVYEVAGDEKDEEISLETQLENSLAGYWNFDEDTGGVATDLSGNGNDGTIHGAKLVDGRCGTALSFDGVDDYIEVLTLEDSHTSDWTEEAWIKTTDLSAGVIMCKRHKGSQESLTLHIGCWAGNNKKNNGLAYFSDDEANYEVGAVGTTNVADGKWHHLVGVRKSSNFYIYVDGNLEGHNNINIGKFALNLIFEVREICIKTRMPL